MLPAKNSDQNTSQLPHLSLRVVGARGVGASFHGRMERPNAREIASAALAMTPKTLVFEANRYLEVPESLIV